VTAAAILLSATNWPAASGTQEIYIYPKLISNGVKPTTNQTNRVPIPKPLWLDRIYLLSARKNAKGGTNSINPTSEISNRDIAGTMFHLSIVSPRQIDSQENETKSKVSGRVL
jgi:hypothetical protein